MDTRSRRIVLCTSIAGVLSVALPAAAAERRPLPDVSGLRAGLAGQAVSDEELRNIRGRYVLPSGSTVVVQIGNGDSTSTTYYQRDPATPGSATVTTTGGTSVTAYAATGTGTTSSSFSRSLSTVRSFGARY